MTASLALDAESLYSELRRAVQPLMGPHTRLAGVISGGWWLAERLHADLGREGEPGAVSSEIGRAHV